MHLAVVDVSNSPRPLLRRRLLDAGRRRVPLPRGERRDVLDGCWRLCLCALALLRLLDLIWMISNADAGGST
jgi:hypothetical protein